MKVFHGELCDITRYLANHAQVALADREREFETLLRRIQRFKRVDRDTTILEIGTGIGWFPVLCLKKGLQCKGLEISPQLVEHARYLGRQHGVEPDIQLGNIEDTDIGTGTYDVIMALSTFEHVQNWRDGLKRVFNALKPNGVFYFISTNKFSFRSGEYNFTLYGWLPDSWRYRLRSYVQGEDIMKLGIDFNQFTYFQLKRFFKQLGFKTVLDVFQFVEHDTFAAPTTWKRTIARLCKAHPALRHLALCFHEVTHFICIK